MPVVPVLLQEGPRVPDLLRRRVGEKDLVDLAVGGDAEDRVAAAPEGELVYTSATATRETRDFAVF